MLHCTHVVMLQPFDVNAADKSKHKFMVQSLFPPPGEVKLEEIVRRDVEQIHSS